MISEREKWGKPWDHHRYWPVGAVCSHCRWAEEREKVEFTEAEETGICESEYQRRGSYADICTEIAWVCCSMLSYACLWLKSRRLGMLVVPRSSSVWWFFRRTHRNWHIVILLWKDTKQKSAKGKGAWGEVWKKPGVSFQEASPSGISAAMSCGITCRMLSTRDAH